MKRYNIINKLIEKYDYKSYLEIGVRNGMTFNKVHIDQKESVDPNELNSTYKVTSDVFFKKYPEKSYDIIFIDGLHHTDQVDRDIINSINSLNTNGTIVLHDCNPIKKEHQIVPKQCNIWNGDVWKSIVKFRFKEYDKFKCFVINTDHGLGIIRRGKSDVKFNLPENLDYDWLELNRTTALDLISVSEFLEKWV